MQAWKNWFSKVLNTVEDTQQNSDILESSASYLFCLSYLMWQLVCASFKILSPVAISLLTYKIGYLFIISNLIHKSLVRLHRLH